MEQDAISSSSFTRWREGFINCIVSKILIYVSSINNPNKYASSWQIHSKMAISIYVSYSIKQ